MSYKKSVETRSRILESAAALFTKHSYYEIGISDIAREAGIGRATFYYYFEDKEKVARALFDSFVERIYAAADTVVPIPSSGEFRFEDRETLVLSAFVKYILLFKYIAQNDATRTVYFDLVNFADYDRPNIERLTQTEFRHMRELAAAYGKKLSDAQVVAMLVSSNAVAKSVFKAVSRGVLDFSLEEAADYFFTHVFLPDIHIPSEDYQKLLARAISLCNGINLL